MSDPVVETTEARLVSVEGVLEETGTGWTETGFVGAEAAVWDAVEFVSVMAGEGLLWGGLE